MGALSAAKGVRPSVLKEDVGRTSQHSLPVPVSILGKIVFKIKGITRDSKPS